MGKTSKKQEILQSYLTLPEIKIEYATIFIEGTSPLVMKPFSIDSIEDIEKKETTPKNEQPKKKEYKVKVPYEIFGNSFYWITQKPVIKTEQDWLNALKEKPKFGFQVGGIRESALNGALRAGKIPNLVSGRAYFFIENAVTDTLYGMPVVEILYKNPPIMRKDCLDTYNSGASMTYRSMFMDWSIKLDVSYLSELINIETIMYWFELGGFGVGLGEYRNEKGGSWGSYRISRTLS